MAYVLDILHEVQFNVPDVVRNIHDAERTLQSECAWPVAPFVNVLLSRGCRVLHLVRNPLDCIASMVQCGMFKRVDHVSDLFIQQHITVPHDGTQIEKCAMVWLTWNRLLSGLKLPRIRIEDVVNVPPVHTGPLHVPLKRKRIIQVWDLATEYGYRF